MLLRETHEAFECAAPADAVQALSDLTRTISGRQLALKGPQKPGQRYGNSHVVSLSVIVLQ